MKIRLDLFLIVHLLVLSFINMHLHLIKLDMNLLKNLMMLKNSVKKNTTFMGGMTAMKHIV